MNSNSQKLVAYVALAFVAACLLAVWGLFAYHGRTDIAPFIAQIGSLLTIVVAAITALGGYHARTSKDASESDSDSSPAPVAQAPVVLPTTVNK